MRIYGVIAFPWETKVKLLTSQEIRLWRLSHHIDGGSNLPATCLQLGSWESRVTQNLEFPSDNLLFLMDNHTGIPLILRSMFAPYTVQVIAKINGDAISSNLAYRDDPLFRSVISTIARSAKKSSNQILTESKISDVLMQTLRRVLELKPSEQLGEFFFSFRFLLCTS